jgi:hypothetical protein
VQVQRCCLGISGGNAENKAIKGDAKDNEQKEEEEKRKKQQRATEKEKDEEQNDVDFHGTMYAIGPSEVILKRWSALSVSCQAYSGNG